jgi:aldehyde:ferredoxin oxidoreductase
MISYDYEAVYAVGSMLGIFNPRGFLQLMEQIEVLALDVMTAGVVLAWATEAQEKGLISEKETQGLKLSWGDWEAYMQAVKLIVSQPNVFYQAMAKGVQYASSRYGGQEFALSFAGNEMPGYHTGPGTHAGVLVGTRHSHLDNAGYSFDQKNLNKGITPEVLADQLVTEESWRQVLTSLVICLFARGIYTPDIVSRSLKIAGYNLGENELKALGQKIYREKYAFKIREGFKPESLIIPHRILETPAPGGPVNQDYLRETVGCVIKSINS